MSDGDLAKRLKAKFTEFDKDKSHTISKQKLNSVLSALDPSFTQEELDALFETADKNGNGVIEYEEFIDFICFLSEDSSGVPAAGAPTVYKDPKLHEKIKLLDINAWKKAATDGALGFMSDKQAGAIRSIVLNYPDLEAQSPEGLTLAEEFVLIWQDSETGMMAEYSYFGQDEPYHNALFGACLLGLKARNLLDFTERKCHYLGNYFLPEISGSPPSDSKVLSIVYDELASRPDNSLKMWFEQKSGKWGQDGTTKEVLASLVERGILGAGEHGDTDDVTTYPLKNKEIDSALKKRLVDVAYGNRDPDTRSMAILALCRTVDMRNPEKPDVMFENIFGKAKAAEAVEKVDKLVSKVLAFQGVTVEMINSMLDELPYEAQNELCSDEFWNNAYALFDKLDKDKSGKLECNDLEAAAHECLPKKLADELLVDKTTFVKLVLLFDQDNDGYIEKDELVGFLMWCKAMTKFSQIA